ncbi:MAG: hybrid sensor histidine kinase/response regulator [Promethearchaeota archaeon]
MTSLNPSNSLNNLNTHPSTEKEEFKQQIKKLKGKIKSLEEERDSLQKNAYLFRLLADHSNDVIWMSDLNFNISYINKAIVKLLGRPISEHLKLKPSDYNTPSSIIKINRMVNEAFHELEIGTFDFSGSHAIEIQQIHKDGHILDVEILFTVLFDSNIKPTGILGITHDISDRKQNERLLNEIEQQQKFESLGILAGGVAHEFNNLLASIIGSIQLMQMEENNETTLDLLNDLESSTNRASELTKTLLTFSKGGSPIIKSQKIVKILQDTLHNFFSYSNIIFNLNNMQKDPVLYFDSRQISIVIKNIVQNAIEAMNKNGEIVINNEIKDLDENNPYLLTKGVYFSISFKDSGVGVSELEKQKIFTPFYSTKQGHSGLGLSTCYSILKKHNGIITFNSIENLGTDVTIFLPIPNYYKKQKKSQVSNIIPEEEKIRKIRTSTISNQSLEKKDKYRDFKGHILVMDDDNFVQKVFLKVLKRFGFDVTITHDGQEAIEYYKKAFSTEEQIDLVILDLTVPRGLGGKDTIIELRKINPNIKAIATSGYSHDPIMANYQNFGFNGALSKPFTIQKIYDKCEEFFKPN